MAKRKTAVVRTPNDAAIRRRLLAWFRRHARDLPWRRSRDPYTIWLSEIMLQQTRVETVRPYFERFVKAFPRVEDLATARIDRVLKLWEGLGYYSRARNLHAAAKQIVKQFNGAFPQRAEQWQSLPGVGRYTAGAIASIAFGERAAVLDGNVKRVLTRVYDIGDSIDRPATQSQLWQIAEHLVPKQRPGDFNQAMMELGATLCTQRSPQCLLCPLQTSCRSFAAGTVEQRPVRNEKKAVPHYDIVAGAIRRNGRYLIGRRQPGGLLGGLWELPGGKVESGETHKQALRREIKEETDLDVTVGQLIAEVAHAYSHFRITLCVYACTPKSGDARPLYHTDLKWVPKSRFSRYAFPAATLKAFAQWQDS
jgi:A/G-specific adenine glycosylase